MSWVQLNSNRAERHLETVKEQERSLNMLWVFLELIMGTTLSVSAQVYNRFLPLEMTNCTLKCHCWFRNGTSIDLLSSSNCLNFCADDHTKPCLNSENCSVGKNTCEARCGSLSFNCIDYPLDTSQQTTLVEWMSYALCAIVAVVCVAAIIHFTVKKFKYR